MEINCFPLINSAEMLCMCSFCRNVMFSKHFLTKYIYDSIGGNLKIYGIHCYFGRLPCKNMANSIDYVNQFKRPLCNGKYCIVPKDLDKQFFVLKKCNNKFDRLVHEKMPIRELTPSLNVQSDSIRTKLCL